MTSVEAVSGGEGKGKERKGKERRRGEIRGDGAVDRKRKEERAAGKGRDRKGERQREKEDSCSARHGVGDCDYCRLRLYELYF